MLTLTTDTKVTKMDCIYRVYTTHQGRSLHHSPLGIRKLRNHYSKHTRFFIPYDAHMSATLPNLVLPALTGEAMRLVRDLGYEVTFFRWQDGVVENKSCLYSVGDYLVRRGKRRDVVLLLQGSGMQRHINCVLSLARKKKIEVITDHDKPAASSCRECYCVSNVSQRQ